MKDAYREGIVKENMQRARKDYVGLKPGFNRGDFYADNFNRCWRAFDAFISSEFPNSQVGKRIEGFVKHYELWYEATYLDSFSSRFKESIDALSKTTITDMTPNSRRPPVTINDKGSLKEVIGVIYRIRCNLDHGAKQMTENRNIFLVENGFYLLYEIMEKICVKEGISF